MHGETLALARLDRFIWALVTLIAVIVLAAPIVSDFYIVWHAFIAPAVTCIVLVAISSCYRRWRAEPRLASALTSTAQIVAFAAVGAPLSYLAAGANFPLHDPALAAIDHALGLDWKALLAWMNAWPKAHFVLRPIYSSLTLQMTTVVLCLACCGRLVWLRVYTLAFLFAALVSIAVSVVLPAAGAWPYYGVTATESPMILPLASSSWPVFFGVREGTVRALVAIGSEGIITFPSLHAALAVVVVAALWPVAPLRWAFLALNTTMLFATPIDGSHYFIDVGAGVGVAVPSLMAARAVAARAASGWTSQSANLVEAHVRA